MPRLPAACGVAHLMLRNDDGTWRKAPAKMTADEIATVLNGDANRYFIAATKPTGGSLLFLPPRFFHVKHYRPTRWPVRPIRWPVRQ